MGGVVGRDDNFFVLGGDSILVLQVIARAGHAGYVEAPDAYSALIDAFCRQCDGSRGTP